MNAACRLPHQYVERHTGRVATERLYGDRLVRWVYSDAREHMPALFSALTSRRINDLVATLTFDRALHRPWTDLRDLPVRFDEMLDEPSRRTTVRDIFERRIRYWDCRPMPEDPAVVLSPSDARILVGGEAGRSLFRLKGKFFDLAELLGSRGAPWTRTFRDADWVVLRLTPDRYHYNHSPVDGTVADFYEIDGGLHSCNPSAILQVATLLSRNRRAVTVLDTDTPAGSGLGLVAMIEVGALMIGRIEQCYSNRRYEEPVGMRPGLRLARGSVKSRFLPGSSTVVLLFERGRIAFDADLILNQRRDDVCSRYSEGFGRALVETDVHVRESIGRRRETDPSARAS